jgi:hypothetical protein
VDSLSLWLTRREDPPDGRGVGSPLDSKKRAARRAAVRTSAARGREEARRREQDNCERELGRRERRKTETAAEVLGLAQVHFEFYS